MHIRIYYILSAFLLNFSVSFAEPNPTESSTDSSETQKEIEEAIPAWLARSSFQVKDRLVLRFDGSEEAGGILRSSESWNRVLFKNSENWRVLREYPFTHSSREVVSLNGEQFILSSRNRKIPSPKVLTNQMWLEVVLGPYRMAKEMGFSIADSNFSKWLEEVQKLKEPLTTDTGAKLRVEKLEAAKTKGFRLILEGPYFHDNKTKVQVLEEWTLEYEVPVTEKDLRESLIGGSS